MQLRENTASMTLCLLMIFNIASRNLNLLITIICAWGFVPLHEGTIDKHFTILTNAVIKIALATTKQGFGMV